MRCDVLIRNNKKEKEIAFLLLKKLKQTDDGKVILSPTLTYPMNTSTTISRILDTLHLGEASSDSYIYLYMNELIECFTDETAFEHAADGAYTDLIQNIRYLYAHYGFRDVRDEEIIQHFYKPCDPMISLYDPFVKECFERLHPADESHTAWIREMNGDLFQVTYSYQYGVDTLRESIRAYDEEQDENAPSYVYTLSLVEDAPEDFSPQYLLVRLPRCGSFEAKHCDIIDATEDGLHARLYLNDEFIESYRGESDIIHVEWSITMNLITGALHIDQYMKTIRGNGSPSMYGADEDEQTLILFRGSLGDFRDGKEIHDDSSLDMRDPELREEVYQTMKQRFGSLGLSI
jgi:hypothetical protein